MKLALELDSERVGRGERLTGRVRVLEGGPSRSLALALGFFERSRDYSAAPYSADEVLHRGELATGQVFEFGLLVPDEAPPSVTCKHSELGWELAIKSDEPGLDTLESRRVVVS